MSAENWVYDIKLYKLDKVAAWLADLPTSSRHGLCHGRTNLRPFDKIKHTLFVVNTIFCYNLQLSIVEDIFQCNGGPLGKLDGVGPVDNRPSTD